MATNRKNKDVPDTTSEQQTADEAAEPRANESHSKSPLWTHQSNRVSASIWKHDQKGGSRYTIAICRPYFNQKEGQWKRSYFYDRQDLPDVEKCRSEALKYLSGVTDQAPVA